MIVAAFLILAGLFNHLMDREEELGGKKASWTNKYKLNRFGTPEYTNKRPWYYLGLHKPKYKERFPYSTTILVSLTDLWHLLQFLFHTCWQIALSVAAKDDIVEILIAFIVVKTIFSISFQISRNILK